MTAWTAPIWPCQANSARLDRITGSPASSRYCLGPLPPARIPRPAATTTAATEGPIRFDQFQSDPALALARSPGRQKDFHRSHLCCNAALAPPEFMAKLYAEFQTPIIWAECEPSNRRRNRHRGKARVLHRRRCSAESCPAGAHDGDYRCAVPPLGIGTRGRPCRLRDDRERTAG